MSKWVTKAGVEFKGRLFSGCLIIDDDGKDHGISSTLWPRFFEPLAESREPILAGELNMARELFTALQCGDEYAVRASLGELISKPSPIPNSWDADVVTVNRGTLKRILDAIESDPYYGQGNTAWNKDMAELRSVLRAAEKPECEHRKTGSHYGGGFERDGEVCDECKAVRLYGPWQPAEKGGPR